MIKYLVQKYLLKVNYFEVQGSLIYFISIYLVIFFADSFT